MVGNFGIEGETGTPEKIRVIEEKVCKMKLEYSGSL